MKKKKYEAPVMHFTEVEVENGFMSASIYEKEENTKSLDIESQEKGAEFDFSSDSEWQWK